MIQLGLGLPRQLHRALPSHLHTAIATHGVGYGRYQLVRWIGIAHQPSDEGPFSRLQAR
jgi:hypothetical protein